MRARRFNNQNTSIKKSKSLETPTTKSIRTPLLQCRFTEHLLRARQIRSGTRATGTHRTSFGDSTNMNAPRTTANTKSQVQKFISGQMSTNNLWTDWAISIRYTVAAPTSVKLTLNLAKTL